MQTARVWATVQRFALSSEIGLKTTQTGHAAIDAKKLDLRLPLKN
jgi:hypothetical protein